MAWECSDCDRKEPGGRKITVCHHCGRPVCNMHRARFDDDAFSNWPDQAATRVAVHCLDCWQSFHPQAQDMESGSPSPQGLTAA